MASGDNDRGVDKMVIGETGHTTPYDSEPRQRGKETTTKRGLSWRSKIGGKRDVRMEGLGERTREGQQEKMGRWPP
ncbi:hypothetical protein RHGRI_029381 [Rhododendron griersonianum]|uniref:Uncharacterized protein n=1 Tax=Rhododendron griersonianum TaxID=479676 RepID=A0AAV6IJ67_9ERIC|nr:hypothetical protein RHGRI_029381 [Rhododendron griersonianum]